MAEASRLCKEAGAKRCLPLAVSGSFYMSLMQPAGEKLREYLEGIEIGNMRIPVLFNYTGREKNGEENTEELLVQRI